MYIYLAQHYLYIKFYVTPYLFPITIMKNESDNFERSSFLLFLGSTKARKYVRVLYTCLRMAL